MTLGPGDYFGERALLTDEPRAASCTAQGSVLCQMLDAETFNEALSGVQDLLGDRIQAYEHDLKATSVQQLENHIRLYTEALTEVRSAGPIIDSATKRRTSSSQNPTGMKGKVVLEILENVNPESDIKGIIANIQASLQLSFASSVALYLVRNTPDEEDNDGGRPSSPLSLLSCVDLMGDGSQTLQQVALNCASSGVPVTNSEGLENAEDVMFFPLKETDNHGVNFIASPVYFSESESQTQRSLNDIRAVIVVHRPQNVFEALDIDILNSVANHVGEVFRNKNEHLNIIEGIGNVRDIDLCNEFFALRLETLSRFPSHVAREVFLRINIWHGTEPIATEYQVRGTYC
jgi:hypothetical protein